MRDTENLCALFFSELRKGAQGTNGEKEREIDRHEENAHSIKQKTSAHIVIEELCKLWSVKDSLCIKLGSLWNVREHIFEKTFATPRDIDC